METENVVVICLTVCFLAFIGMMGYFVYSSGVDEKEKYNTCVSSSGSWVMGNCIHMGSK